MQVAQDAGHIEVYLELERFVKQAGHRIQESVQHSESESSQHIKVGVAILSQYNVMRKWISIRTASVYLKMLHIRILLYAWVYDLGWLVKLLSYIHYQSRVSALTSGLHGVKLFSIATFLISADALVTWMWYRLVKFVEGMIMYYSVDWFQFDSLHYVLSRVLGFVVKVWVHATEIQL